VSHRRVTVRRPAGHARRAHRIRRASAGLSPIRAGAALAVILSLAALYGVTASPVFSVDDIRVEGGRLTPDAEVRSRLGIASGANLFTVATEPLEASLADLPAIRSAEVSVALPNALVVRLTEREPILVWLVGRRRLLVDVDGRAFAEQGADAVPATAELPVVTDRRLTARALVVGSSLDPVELDAARRLAGLVPADVGSAARTLAVAVTDENGFTLRTGDSRWTAVFGFYTPTRRTTELIPGQVRLLRSLLAGREQTVERVVLASDTEGTLTVRETPRPSPGEAP
jgi:hypothetical protein